jgi:hypothetical protein
MVALILEFQKNLFVFCENGGGAGTLSLSFFMIDPIEILYFVVLIMIDPMQTRFAYKKKSMEELAKIF